MKAKNLLLTLAVGAMAISCNNSGSMTQTSASLKTTADSASFYIGYMYGSGLQQMGFSEVNREALIAGLNSAIAKKEVGKDPREIQMFLNGFMQEVAMKKATENAEKGKKFSTLIFNQDDCDVEIPLEQLEFDVSTLENVRSIHLTIKNCNEEKIAAPSVKYETKNDGWRVLTDPYTYVEPGETKQITYVLSENYWKDNECSTMKKLVIAYDEIATTINMELYNVQITERSPGK